ncbi:unnamed protein product [Ixodes hexagonus]
MKAAKEVFGEHVTTRGCFFHLCESTHRKVRELGLLDQYKTDCQFIKLCGMLNGLAFLPPQLVPEGLSYMRRKATGDIGDMLDYFYSTYVNGPFRISSAATSATRAPLAVTMRRRRPEFPSELWNVHEATHSRRRPDQQCLRRMEQWFPEACWARSPKRLEAH